MTLEKQMPWPELVDITYNKLSPKVIKSSEEKEFKEWMLSKQHIGNRFDYILVGKLFLIWKEKLKKSNDYVVVIVGREGVGKTTLGIQVCAWIDDTFNIDRICLERKEVFANLRVLNTQALQIDEGALSLFSRESMTLEGRNLVKVFMTIRRKSLFFVICCPSYQALDNYIRNHRVALLIDIRQRGHYTAYFGEALRLINENIHRKKKISSVKVADGFFWQGNFNKPFPNTINEEEYLKKKDLHIDSFLAQMESQEEKEEDLSFITPVNASKQMGATPHAIREYIKKGIIKAVKIGDRWFISRKEFKRLLLDGASPTSEPIIKHI